MSTDAEVVALRRRLSVAQPFNIGFPGATDVDFTPLARLLTGQLLNNVGDPFVDGMGVNHTKAWERHVVGHVAELFRAPPRDWWGYVTSGGSEGNLFGLWLATRCYPGARVFSSDAAHPSVAKAASLLGLPHVTVRTSGWGELDYDDLFDQVEQRRSGPVVVVATAGTTMTEAVDDVRIIRAVLDEVGAPRCFVHVDAALSGIPLALLDPAVRPGFDFADGADSVSVSGHKFLGATMPCGVVVTRASHRNQLGREGGHYVGCPDPTIGNSRNGHTVAMLWYVLRTFGIDGLRQRADTSRELADYLHRHLMHLGWDPHRFAWGFTVTFPTPPRAVTDRWVLPSHGGWSHVVTMPGVTRAAVDAFLQDMANLHRFQPRPARGEGWAA